jgi:cytochrome c oxidase subunit 3
MNAHNPALLHHFSDAQQQKNAASLGMWLFLVTEIMFFGGMFCAYLIYRVQHFNAFAAGKPATQHQAGRVQHRRPDHQFGHGCVGGQSGGSGQAQMLVGYLVVTVCWA